MGYNKTPLTAFSDGTDAITPLRPHRPRPLPQPARAVVVSAVRASHLQPGGRHLHPAVARLSTRPAISRPAQDASSTSGASPRRPASASTRTARRTTAPRASLPATAAYHTHFGIQDAARPSDYLDAGTLASNKFIDVTARTVRCFSGRTCGSDYAPGHGAVLVWGRPGYDSRAGTPGAHVPAGAPPADPSKRRRALQLRPRYFAGSPPRQRRAALDPATSRAPRRWRWTASSTATRTTITPSPIRRPSAGSGHPSTSG